MLHSVDLWLGSESNDGGYVALNRTDKDKDTEKGCQKQADYWWWLVG